MEGHALRATAVGSRILAADKAAYPAYPFGMSFALLKSLSTFLYGVTTFDTASYVGVMLALLVSALVACAIPAYRAARTDPVRALRSRSRGSA